MKSQDIEPISFFFLFLCIKKEKTILLQNVSNKSSVQDIQGIMRNVICLRIHWFDITVDILFTTFMQNGTQKRHTFRSIVWIQSASVILKIINLLVLTQINMTSMTLLKIEKRVFLVLRCLNSLSFVLIAVVM